LFRLPRLFALDHQDRPACVIHQTRQAEQGWLSRSLRRPPVGQALPHAFSGAIWPASVLPHRERENLRVSRESLQPVATPIHP